jgi:hypothetical protein
MSGTNTHESQQHSLREYSCKTNSNFDPDSTLDHYFSLILIFSCGIPVSFLMLRCYPGRCRVRQQKLTSKLQGMLFEYIITQEVVFHILCLHFEQLLSCCILSRKSIFISWSRWQGRECYVAKKRTTFLVNTLCCLSCLPGKEHVLLIRFQSVPSQRASPVSIVSRGRDYPVVCRPKELKSLANNKSKTKKIHHFLLVFDSCSLSWYICCPNAHSFSLLWLTSFVSVLLPWLIVPATIHT